MKKLRFQKDEGSAFYKDLTRQLDDYFEKNQIAKCGNRTMHFKIGMYFGLVVLFYILLLRADSRTAFFSIYLLLGLAVLLTAFNVSHDAAHGVAVRSRFWNKVLFQLSFNLQGNNAYVWGRNHNESHHLYTNIEGSDIDVLHNPLVRMTHNQKLKWFHRYQHLYCPLLYMLYSLNWFLFRETLMLFRYSSRTIQISMPRLEVVRLVVFKLLYIGYMIVVPALVLPFSWSSVLTAFLVQHAMISLLFVAVLGVSHLSDYVAHPEPDAEGRLHMSWPKLQMITSVDYDTDSVFFNWTLGGFNAHALHHLLPNISHVHYLNVLPIFRDVCRKHSIPYLEMPYRKALSAHFRFLKGMGSTTNFKTAAYEG